MHCIEYDKLVWKLAARYGATAKWIEEYEIVSTSYRTVGDVYFDGELRFNGRFDLQNRELLRSAAKYRDEELKKNKYKKMTAEELRVHITLIEAKGIINGKARILRSENHGRSAKCAAIDVAAF